MIARLEALTRRLATASLAVAAAFLGVMAAVVIYTVVQRYLLDHTPYWSEEFPRLLLVWVTFVGAIYGAWRGTHLSSGLLPMIISGPVATRIIARVAMVTGVIFASALAYAAFKIAMVTSGHLTAAMQISAAWAYLAAAVGGCGIAIVLAVAAVRGSNAK